MNMDEIYGRILEAFITLTILELFALFLAIVIADIVYLWVFLALLGFALLVIKAMKEALK